MQQDETKGYSGIDFKESSLSLKQALDKYVNKRSQSDDFLIYPVRTREGYIEGVTQPPCVYHLLDFKADKGMRGVHLIIQTFPFMDQCTAKAVHVGVSEHFGISFAGGFCTHTPEEIVNAVRTIERKVISPSKFEQPLFSRRKGWKFFYFGLMFELDKLLKK